MLKKLFLILSIGFILFCSCNFHKKEGKPVVWEDWLTVEENIAGHAVPFQNDSVFPFLNEIMKNRTVLFLGEAGHSDSTTHNVKDKMISYLMKNNSITSIGYEGFSFLSLYMLYHLEENRTGSYAREMKDYYNKLSHIYNDKIKIWGIDIYADSWILTQ
jgi:hypothetical protein